MSEGGQFASIVQSAAGRWPHRSEINVSVKAVAAATQSGRV
jgi:hypothetical protein